MELGMGDLLTLYYPGVTVELCKPEGSPPAIPAAMEFHVVTLRVSDRRWVVSPGIHVGMTRSEIQTILGTPDSTESTNGAEELRFSPFSGDAFAVVTLKNGVVVEIEMSEDWS